MDNDSLIEDYLSRLADGEGLIEEFLGILSNEIIYAPVVNFQNLRDGRGTNVIRVASFSDGSRTLVPVFTSEDYFIEWSAGKHQCFSLAAADLALTLPKGSWMIVNPGRDNAVELAPDEVAMLAEVEPLYPAAPAEEPLEEYAEEEQVSEQDPGGTGEFPAQYAVAETGSYEQRYYQQSEEEPFAEEEEYPTHAMDLSEAPTLSFRPAGADLRGLLKRDEDSLQQELFQILSQYPEVEEAYLHATGGGHAHAMLGLLTSGMEAERRFLLIDQIAEVSRDYFGTAGAIEVYDDLDVTTSSSWTLFNTLNPFYVKSQDSGLVVERQRIEDEESDDGLGDKRSGLSWRKKGSRLLGALVGRG